MYMWDTLLIYLIADKLDQKTVREWETCKYVDEGTSSELFRIYFILKK